MMSSSPFFNIVININILLSSFLITPVFSTNATHHHGIGSTNQLGGIQEELQLLKETVHALVTTVDVVHDKVDSNTKNIQTLINKVVDSSKKIDEVVSKVDSNSKKLELNSERMDSTVKNVDSSVKKMDSTIKKVDSSVKKMDSAIKKVDSTVAKVDSNAKKTDSNTRSIASLSDELSPTVEECRSLPTKICGGCKCRDDKRLPKKYYCDCTNLPAKRDCKQFHQEGFRIDGVYKIHQNNIRIIKVFCDQTTDGGGWAVFQRRMDGSVKFYRDWLSYKTGFGDLQHEFWLGNTNLFTLSLQGLYPSGNELRIELTDWMGVQKFAKYGSFDISNEDRKFQLNVGGYSGTAGNSFGPTENGMKFSTFDQDNDNSGSKNCAVEMTGAWWYNNCYLSNLNGMYYDFQQWQTYKGIIWQLFQGYSYSLKHVEMKLRRKN